MEHFYEHQSEDPSLDLVHFLKLHYLTVTESKDNKDQKLPFKSHPEMVYSPIGKHFSRTEDLIFRKFFEARKKEIIRINEFTYTSDFLNKIWQPPKFSL